MTTTTRLRLRPRDRLRTWLAQRDPVALVAVAVLPLIAVAALARQLLIASPIIASAPTPPLPIIIIATAPAQLPPTAAPQVQQVVYQPPAAQRWVPAFSSPDGAVLGAIPEPVMSAITGRYGDGWLSTAWQGATVWLRTADLGANLANAAPMPAAPAPQIVYQVVNQPAADPPPAVEAAPTAPAYQIASERQTNIQQHYVQPISYPTRAPMEQDSVTQAWARQQYAAEHP